MNIKALVMILVLCLAGILFGCTAQPIVAAPAEEAVASQSQIESADLYLIGEEGYAPISYIENGEVVGISPDIIREAFRRMNMTVKLELAPWERCKQMVFEGYADGFFSPYMTVEREKNYQYAYEPLMIEKNVFVVKADSTITFNGDITSLKDYTIGTLIGYATLEEYIKEGVLTKIDYSAETSEALKKLLADGRGVDLYVNTNYIIWYNAKVLGVADQLRELETPLVENPSYLAFTRVRDMSDIARRFEETLKAMKDDGTYERILEKYIGVPQS